MSQKKRKRKLYRKEVREQRKQLKLKQKHE